MLWGVGGWVKALRPPAPPPKEFPPPSGPKGGGEGVEALLDGPKIRSKRCRQRTSNLCADQTKKIKSWSVGSSALQDFYKLYANQVITPFGKGDFFFVGWAIPPTA